MAMSVRDLPSSITIGEVRGHTYEPEAVRTGLGSVTCYPGAQILQGTLPYELLRQWSADVQFVYALMGAANITDWRDVAGLSNTYGGVVLPKDSTVTITYTRLLNTNFSYGIMQQATSLLGSLLGTGYNIEGIASDITQLSRRGQSTPSFRDATASLNSVAMEVKPRLSKRTFSEAAELVDSFIRRYPGDIFFAPEAWMELTEARGMSAVEIKRFARSQEHARIIAQSEELGEPNPLSQNLIARQSRKSKFAIKRALSYPAIQHDLREIAYASEFAGCVTWMTNAAFLADIMRIKPAGSKILVLPTSPKRRLQSDGIIREEALDLPSLIIGVVREDVARGLKLGR